MSASPRYPGRPFERSATALRLFQGNGSSQDPVPRKGPRRLGDLSQGQCPLGSRGPGPGACRGSTAVAEGMLGLWVGPHQMAGAGGGGMLELGQAEVLPSRNEEPSAR